MFSCQVHHDVTIILPPPPKISAGCGPDKGKTVLWMSISIALSANWKRWAKRRRCPPLKQFLRTRMVMTLIFLVLMFFVPYFGNDDGHQVVMQ